MAQGRVTVVGSLNIDLVTRVARHVRPGETISGEGLDLLPGGKGANQAVAAARAGAAVRMVGRVGADAHGSAYLLGLRRHNVDVGQVLRTAGTPSGHALVVVDDKGENAIIVVGGANARMTPEDVVAAASTVTDADVLLLQLELPISVVTEAAVRAHEAGVHVVLNPSPISPLPAELLDAVDTVVANEHEAAALSSFHGAVVTTLGAQGAAYRAAGREEISVPAVSTRAVDTTGAGDAFTGAFGAALARGDDPRSALEEGVLAGARAVQWRGAQGWSLGD